MKVAVSNIAWTAAENDAAAAVLRHTGARGVEVAPGMLFDDPAAASASDIAAVRDRWSERDLEIVAVQALLYGHPELTVFDDPETRARTSEYLRGIIRLAAGLGAGALVFGSPRNRARGGVSMEDAVDIAADFFAPLGDFAARHDTTLCLEANAPAYGCDFICRTDEAVELVRRVDSPGFRVQLDTSTMAMNGEDYRATIRAALPWASHFHISEPHLAPVGSDGKVPAAIVLDELERSGYDGWVSIEMRAAGDGKNVEALRAALAHVAEAWNTVRAPGATSV